MPYNFDLLYSLWFLDLPGVAVRLSSHRYLRYAGVFAICPST